MLRLCSFLYSCTCDAWRPELFIWQERGVYATDVFIEEICLTISMQYLVYIVECADGTYYTGYTNNLQKRLWEHNSGKGARYTSGRYPVSLKYNETCDSRGEALRREWEIKKLGRKEKEELIKKGDKAKKSS